MTDYKDYRATRQLEPVTESPLITVLVFIAMIALGAGTLAVLMGAHTLFSHL